jgi:hypothetical protein
LSVCGQGDDDEDQQPASQRIDVPDTPATRLLQHYGVQDRATIRRFAAAALEDIERAERRRAELGYSSGLIPKILDDNMAIWGGCGKRVDNSLAPPLDEEDSGHRKYTRGALGRYIRTGLEAPPPRSELPPGDPEQPADDPELARYRGRGLPWWGDGEAHHGASRVDDAQARRPTRGVRGKGGWHAVSLRASAHDA